MGAEQFISRGRGATASGAFNAAVQDAEYESGHGGYTGTIAEKSEFRMVDVERETAKAIAGLQVELKVYTVAGQKKLQRDLAKLEQWVAGYYLLEHQQVHVWAGETLGAACTRRRKSVRAQIKKLKTKKTRGYALADYLLGQNAAEKWGPALCVQLTHKATGANDYLFFGLASC